MHNQEFENPHSLANKIGRLAWRWAWVLLFRPTPPRLLGGWRTFLLRCFGAKIRKTWVHPSAQIWAPWLLEAGDHVFIDRNVNLYNAYGIKLGDNVIISFDSTLCTASHDHTDPKFRLTGGQITIGSDCWLGADVFVGPGVTIGEKAVVGARASVFSDLPAEMVCVGFPARPIRKREIRA